MAGMTPNELLLYIALGSGVANPRVGFALLLVYLLAVSGAFG